MEEIKLDNLDTVDLELNEVSIDNTDSTDLQNADFGSGIELLMNDKMKSTKKSNGGEGGSEKSFGDSSLRNIENDLNEIDKQDFNKEVKFEQKSSFQNKPNIEIAKATSTMEIGNETWDGFKNINSIDLEFEKKQTQKKSSQDILKEKFELLRKLENLENKGATLSKKYTMDSDLDEMKGEYEHLIQEKEKSNSVKFQGKILTTMITGLEFLNSKFDPFDIKLDGWSEQINENIDDYDEIFAELHEKYKSKAKMAPELKLLFQLASSGIMIHMTNTMFKSALPGMDDIMRQNPDLMNHFTKAAISSMENTSPGLSNFMNDFGMSHSRDTNEIRSRPEFVNEPQNRSQTSMFNEEPPRQMRQEMKGPSNIDSLLSSLGNNSVRGSEPPENKNVTLDKSSTISIDDIDNISLSSTTSGTKKKSSKRKSDKNTISLSI